MNSPCTWSEIWILTEQKCSPRGRGKFKTDMCGAKVCLIKMLQCRNKTLIVNYKPFNEQEQRQQARRIQGIKRAKVNAANEQKYRQQASKAEGSKRAKLKEASKHK